MCRSVVRVGCFLLQLTVFLVAPRRHLPARGGSVPGERGAEPPVVTGSNRQSIRAQARSAAVAVRLSVEEELSLRPMCGSGTYLCSAPILTEPNHVPRTSYQFGVRQKVPQVL